MSSVDELVRWLGEQLDTEAAEAQLTADAFGAVWTTDDAMESVGSDTGADVVSEPYAPRSFIAAHDPARVLREIDAKRGIVARYEFACKQAADPGLGEGERETWVQVGGALQSCVLLLAGAYEDRPGFREEWRL